ncbi:MAG: D-aminoacylase [Dehalococcoidia bacterium]|nr:D-aminoacylase [Dehalococcoidia bacterium]
MPLDTLIANALILDGDGTPRYHGAIGVKDGRIVAVGDVPDSAAQTINAHGLAAASGFWDIHTHYDAQLLWDPVASSSSWHGVTTIITGNCGFTLAPVRPSDQEYTLRSLARVEDIHRAALETTLPWRWERFAGYLAVLEGNLGVNVLAMVGHSALRRYVMGPEASVRVAMPQERQAMAALLHEELRAGAMGFTTTMAPTHWDGEGNPVPSRLADHAELLALAGAMQGMECGFIQGAWDPTRPSDLPLQRELVRASGRPYCWPQIAHTPDQPADAWRAPLASLAAERAAGYPGFAMAPPSRTHYWVTFEHNTLMDRWAVWKDLSLQSPPERRRQLRDPAVRQRMCMEMLVEPLPMFPFTWGQVSLGTSVSGRWRRFEGERVPEIARALGKDPLDAVLDLALDEDLAMQFEMEDSRYPDEQALVQMLRTPHVCVGQSDAGAHMMRNINAGYATHLLGYWVRERQAMTLEEAVHLLAARPADEIGVRDRGRLAPGQAADIVLFDPDRVMDGKREYASDLPAGARRLVQHAEGIEMVIVGGVVTRRDNRDTGDVGGRILRSTWRR